MLPPLGRLFDMPIVQRVLIERGFQEMGVTKDAPRQPTGRGRADQGPELGRRRVRDWAVGHQVQDCLGDKVLAEQEDPGESVGL